MRKSLILLAVPLLFWQCEKEPELTTPPQTFEAVIKSGGDFDPVVEEETILKTDSSTKTEDGQRFQPVR